VDTYVKHQHTEPLVQDQQQWENSNMILAISAKPKREGEHQKGL
jgi:hypothetical protein